MVWLKCSPCGCDGRKLNKSQQLALYWRICRHGNMSQQVNIRYEMSKETQRQAKKLAKLTEDVEDFIDNWTQGGYSEEAWGGMQIRDEIVVEGLKAIKDVKTSMDGTACAAL